MRRSVFVTLTMGMLFVMVAAAASRGVLRITLKKAVVVDGKSVGPGPCQINWATHSPEADVSFAVSGDVVAKVHGKFVERTEKSAYDGVVTAKDDSGNEVVKEIWFAGKSTVLVLD